MIKFRPIFIADLEMIGRWRSKPRINAVMNTHYDYCPKKQMEWYESICERGMKRFHWLILDDERPVGVMNLADYRPVFQKNPGMYEGETSWGFYIGEDDFKFGAIVPAYLYNHLFLDDYIIDIIHAEVRNNNKGVIKLHLSMGYVIDNIGIETTNMILYRPEWLKQKKWHNLSRELK